MNEIGTLSTAQAIASALPTPRRTSKEMNSVRDRNEWKISFAIYGRLVMRLQARYLHTLYSSFVCGYPHTIITYLFTADGGAPSRTPF